METARLELPATPAAPSVARLFVRCLCEEWGVPKVAEVAQLLSSELVTNAVLHARSSIEVEVSYDETSGLRVDVLDRVPTPPNQMQPRLPRASALAPSTAGLAPAGIAAPRPAGDALELDRIPAGELDSAENGRGLAIVERLAGHWGVETGADGKRVWFTLGSD